MGSHFSSFHAVLLQSILMKTFVFDLFEHFLIEMQIMRYTVHVSQLK